MTAATVASMQGTMVASVPEHYGVLAVRDPTLCFPGSWRAAVRTDWRELRVAPLSIRSDKEVVLGAVVQNEQAFSAAADTLKCDREFVLEVVRLRGEALRHASPELRADREVVLEAVAQDRLALRHASEDIRADVEVVVDAMRRRRYDNHLHCAVHELAAPHHVVREASHALEPSAWRTKISRDWRRLSDAPPLLKDDRDLVGEAIRDSWGEALRYASDQLRGDRDLVIDAVRYRGTNLQYATEDARNDIEVVRAAVEQTWEAIVFAGEVPRSDMDIMLEVLTQHTQALQYASESLRANRDLVLRCVRADGLVLCFAADELQRDHEIALAAFKQNHLALRWVAEEARQGVWAATSEPVFGNRKTTTRWLDVVVPAKADGTPEATAEEAGAVGVGGDPAFACLDGDGGNEGGAAA